MSANILHSPADPSLEPDPRGLGTIFFEKMRQYGDNIAQIDAMTGERQTYKQLLLRCIRVAQEMTARGLTRDDIVTLCVPNTMDACVPFIASIFLRIRVSSLDPSLSSDDSKHLLNIVKPRLIFCDPGSVEMIEEGLRKAGLTSELVVLGETEVHTPFSEFLVSSGTEDQFEVEAVDDIFETAMIFFSSGTTGLPKGICSTHYGLISMQLQWLKGHVVDVTVNYTTLYWISAVACLVVSILTGTTRLLCKKFEAELTLMLIEKYKVTYSFLSPFIVLNLIQHTKNSKYDTSSLKSITIGGSAIGEDQLLHARRSLPHTVVCYAYGMTENNGLATYFDPVTEKHLILSKPLSVGRKLPGYSYKIIDTETGEILGPNKPGELLIKGKCLMPGYHNFPEDSRKAFDKDGFLYSGDVGYYDEDHCFYIMDRVKDVLKYQSWHVPPVELESVLLAHPDVKEAAVFGKPHPIDGEHPTGAVVLKSGSKASEIEIMNFVNERVPERKKLRGGVKIINSLPYTPTGKIRRRELRDSILNNL